MDLQCAMPVVVPPGASIDADADANDQVQECTESDNHRTIYRPEDCIG